MNLRDVDFIRRLVWMMLFVPASYALAVALHASIGGFSMVLFWLCWGIGSVLILFGSNWLALRAMYKTDIRGDAVATIKLFLYAPGVPDEILSRANLAPPKVRVPFDAAELLSSISHSRDPLVREVANRLKDCVNQDKTFNVGRIIENAPILIELMEKLRS